MMSLAVYRKTALVVSLLLMTGCAGHELPHPQTKNMLPTYQKMADELAETSTFATYEHYLAEELIGQIHSEIAGDLDEYVEFLAPPFWFDSISETYQGLTKGRSCLVVNGVSVDGDLISAALEYVDREGVWKVRSVEIGLYETDESLPNEVWCPVRADEF